MGEVFAGRYELVDLIGAGGMGAVWLTWDRRTESYVAAKVLQQSDSASLLRFLREQAVRIDDTHIVMPLGWAGEDDRVLFTMPLIRGGSVATLLGDYGALPEHWVVELLRQLLTALAAVHRARVVHRDVKPANLLLEPTGTARPKLRLTDFGIALPMDGPRLTRTNVILGTSGYLPPEVLAGAEPAPAQDVYAAGRVAIAMLTGQEPGRTEWADGVSLPLATYVRSLISENPLDRPPDGGQALAQLDRLGLPAWVGKDDGVEVFEHIPSPSAGPDGIPAAATAPNAPAPTVVAARLGRPTAVSPLASSAPATARPRISRRVVLGAGALAVGGAVVGLLVLRPWAGEPVTPPATRTTSAATAASSAVGTPSASGSSPSSAPPASAPAVTQTDAAGDVCSFSDVGIRQTAPDGRTVTCLRQGDGSYRWVPVGT